MSESDFSRCARAIRFLVEHRRAQPGLEAVAAAAGVSPYHFQRMFRRWAGISPKRFLQFLTLQEARDLLRASRPLLEASQEVGLSSPSRLHDLFLAFEGMTPGQFKARAQGLTLAWTTLATPFGPAALAALDGKLCALSFLDGDDPGPALAAWRQRWPDAAWRREPEALAGLAGALGARFGPGPHPPLALLLQGTPFQLQVWEALLRIPEGQVRAYGDLARDLGQPRASRAVGAAIGRNPIAYLIPCHRVIQGSGALGGYHWGEDRKRALLALEGARRLGGRDPEDGAMGPR